jgi:hypothetical protein
MAAELRESGDERGRRKRSRSCSARALEESWH